MIKIKILDGLTMEGAQQAKEKQKLIDLGRQQHNKNGESKFKTKSLILPS